MTDEGQPPPGADDGTAGVGSVGEEAAKLFGALSEWASEHGEEAGQGLGQGLAGLVGQAADAAGGIDAHIATDDPECRWCPVCRTIHLVRACTPEVRDQLAVAAAHLMQAAAGLLVAASSSDRRDRSPGEQVQHIDLDDGPDPSGPDPSGPDPSGPDPSGPDPSGRTP